MKKQTERGTKTHRIQVWSAALLALAWPAVVQAQFTYTTNNNAITITGYTGSGAVVIPSATNGYSVTSIGDYAFQFNASVTSVTIPASVTSIGNYSFNGCGGLTSVTIGNGVTSIGDYAFNGCGGLTNATIGNNVINIGNRAFYGCGLTSVTIPDSVTSIGNGAFWTCTWLRSVTIGNSVTSIGGFAFDGCSLIPSVTIPDSVTSIGNYAFYSCVGMTSVTIGNSVNSIGDYAFGLCASVHSVTIPDSVTTIGQWAFETCLSLENVIIGNGVTSIGNDAFNYCRNLTNVTIGNSVTSIGAEAFLSCGSLTSATIPNSVINIGGSAFSGCGLSSVTIGNSVTSIGSSAFSNCGNLTNLTIGNSVISIGSSAFGGCSSLTNVTIPDSVTVIGDNAFSSCSKLGSVAIPDSVTSIGNSAFSSCRGVTNMMIGDSVTNIGDYAFQFCTSLTSIMVDTNNPSYSSVAGVLLNKSQTVLIVYPEGLSGSYTIPNGVTNIKNYAFYICTNLTGVTITESVTSIGDYSFYGCSNLASVTIGNSVISIGNYAFEYCPGLTNMAVPNSVSSIGQYAFYGCGLTGLTIPNSVTNIGAYAFGNCYSLANVMIPNSIASIANNVFQYCSNLTTIVIPSGVTNIGNYAFEYCSSLTNVIIPNSVTTIGANAFFSCSGLINVTIGSSVTSIGSLAFARCTSLTAVYFLGNSPATNSTAFLVAHPTAYYLPGTSGWSSKFDGISTLMLNAPNPNGSLKVTITPTVISAVTYWQVDGGIAQASGATVLGLSVSNHTVSFSTVRGWTTPSNQTINVSANSTATATGVYVIPPVPLKLVGAWITGAPNFADTSGYSPAGTHDGYLVGTNHYLFTNDVPPGWTGVSLYLYAGDTGISISNSSTLDAAYTNTFDNTISNSFTVMFWAKGGPGANSWNPWICKYGESEAGWQFRTGGGNGSNGGAVPCWTVRDNNAGTYTVGGGPSWSQNAGQDDLHAVLSGTASANNLKYYGIDNNWHFYAGTYDTVTGIRNLYIDDTLYAQEMNNTQYMTAPAEHLCIGAKDSPPGNNFGNTAIFEIYGVRIYPGALSIDQINNIMNATSTGPTLISSVIPGSGGNPGSLVLSWSTGTLQDATNILGPWNTNVVASPYTNTMTDQQHYFRISNP